MELGRGRNWRPLLPPETMTKLSLWRWLWIWEEKWGTSITKSITGWSSHVVVEKAGQQWVRAQDSAFTLKKQLIPVNIRDVGFSYTTAGTHLVSGNRGSWRAAWDVLSPYSHVSSRQQTHLADLPEETPQTQRLRKHLASQAGALSQWEVHLNQ